MSRTKKAPRKSPSERLRATFYRLWEKDAEGFKKFDTYYESKMEKLIKYYKKLL